MRSILKLILIGAVLVVVVMHYSDIKQAFSQLWESPGGSSSGSHVLDAVRGAGSATRSVMNHVGSAF